MWLSVSTSCDPPHLTILPSPHSWEQCASAGNRTRVTSTATMYATTRLTTDASGKSLDLIHIGSRSPLLFRPCCMTQRRFKFLPETLRKPLGNPRKSSLLQRKPGGNPPLIALTHPLRPYKAFPLHRGRLDRGPRRLDVCTVLDEATHNTWAHFPGKTCRPTP